MVSPYFPTNFFKIKILVTKAEHNQDVNYKQFVKQAQMEENKHSNNVNVKTAIR